MDKLISKTLNEYNTMTKFFIDNADKIAFLKIKKDKKLNKRIQSIGFICSIFESSVQQENFKRAVMYFVALKKIKKEIENSLQNLAISFQ